MTSKKVQIADTSVVVSSASATTAVETAAIATAKKGIAQGELKAYQEQMLARTKDGTLKFEETAENELTAIKGDFVFKLKLTKTPLAHARTKAGEMIRVRMTSEKIVEGTVVAKKPECNGKEIWAFVKPETEFPKGSAPKSTKVPRVLKPKAIKPDHSNENWL